MAQKTTAALLDMPEEVPRDKPRSRRSAEARREATPGAADVRREPHAVRMDPYGDDDSREYLSARVRGRRVRRGLIPQSRFGRIAAGTALFAFLGGVAALSLALERYLHHDPQFTVHSSSAIELAGNQHLSRSQLLSVFGEDVERNIFAVPLAARKAELEQIPWVEHATVMRLLPDHLRIQVTERTPVAFVRQGGTIGMADASGVLLDIPPDAPGNPSYSFPVVTGLNADQAPEARSQRMHLYTALLKDLDSGGKKISGELSEVDVSDPEDLKALLPSNNAEILVHFGTEHFLERYNRFQEHVAEWRQQYPRLSSVDMRYERQVVLQMPSKDVGPPAAEETRDGSKPETRESSGTVAKAVVNKGLPTADKAKPALARSKQAASRPDQQPTRVAALQTAHAITPREKKIAPAGNARSAEMAKRVEAIKAWMAKRQAARESSRVH